MSPFSAPVPAPLETLPAGGTLETRERALCIDLRCIDEKVVEVCGWGGGTLEGRSVCHILNNEME